MAMISERFEAEGAHDDLEWTDFDSTMCRLGG